MQPPFKIVALVAALATSGCLRPTPEQQADSLTLRSSGVDSRQIQARRYDTRDEAALMVAALGVLQDLGYTVNETSAGTGMINASKDRQGTHIRVSVVVRPTTDRTGMIARVGFQAIESPMFGGQLQLETINDEVVYQQFFERLSKSMFLEAHQK